MRSHLAYFEFILKSETFETPVFLNIFVSCSANSETFTQHIYVIKEYLAKLEMLQKTLEKN